MKTLSYNPSHLEIEFAEALIHLKDQFYFTKSGCQILSIDKKVSDDNPSLIFKLKDKDGDLHEVVLKVIQRSDQ